MFFPVHLVYVFFLCNNTYPPSILIYIYIHVNIIVITLSAAAQCLRPNGIVVITHPLGADFVRKLNEEDPDSVPHHLPTILDFRKMTREQPLVVLDFIEDVDLLNVQKEIQNFQFYYASARKTSYQPLRSVLRLRGPVDKGYGRGGKKLGFPTANLPSRFFSNALEDIPNGVYFGWAVIEDGRAIRSDIRSGRNTWHKAVVNVGLSPTFVGEENREKIVEAHLIVGTLIGMMSRIFLLFYEAVKLNVSFFIYCRKR